MIIGSKYVQMRKRRWYISGKVSGDKDYRTKFLNVEKHMKHMGYKVLNPVMGEKEGKSWSYYLKKDLKKLLKCNGIVLLWDWKESKGAMLELQVALYFNYPVFLYKRNGDIEKLMNLTEFIT